MLNFDWLFDIVNGSTVASAGKFVPKSATLAARKLEQAGADPLSRGAAKPTPPISLRPGTRLVREWRGVTHTALIHADGIEWRG
jgi:hypothetical protein